MYRPRDRRSRGPVACSRDRWLSLPGKRSVPNSRDRVAYRRDEWRRPPTSVFPNVTILCTRERNGDEPRNRIHTEVHGILLGPENVCETLARYSCTFDRVVRTPNFTYIYILENYSVLLCSNTKNDGKIKPFAYTREQGGGNYRETRRETAGAFVTGKQ